MSLTEECEAGHNDLEHPTSEASALIVLMTASTKNWWLNRRRQWSGVFVQLLFVFHLSRVTSYPGKKKNVAVQCPSPTISTSITVSRTDGVAGQQVLDLWTLEDDVFQRCLSAQPDPTVLQRFNRGKCAYLLRDLDVTADLPPRCPLFALQLLGLTHRWWSELEGPDIEEEDVQLPCGRGLYWH